MPKALTITQLRADLYRVIDEVLATGQPQRVSRGGRMVLIVAEDQPRRLELDKLPRRTAVVGDPDELVDQGFADLWQPDDA